MRILFASCHCYVDPSSGAAISARHLLELLAARGHDCRSLSTGVLDYFHQTTVDSILVGQGATLRQGRAALSRGGGVDVFDLNLDGVRVTVLPTISSLIARSPNHQESADFLDLLDQVLDRFGPDVLLTYGGHQVSRHIMARARRSGSAVVFFLRNLAYQDRDIFDDAKGILVASDFVRRHYRRRLGLDCTVLPSPLLLDHVVATDPQPKYLTYVNPAATKGLAVFARIAAELDRTRPDIPLLVVEGRATAANLRYAGLDLSGLNNLHRMASTPDPRDFYRVSPQPSVM